MIIDAVDQADMVVGQIQRSRVFRDHVNFRVAHVLVFNQRNELLIQRLALDRARNPGAWGSSVAAYLFAHETYEQAANRRITEELGITSAELRWIGKTAMNDNGSLKFITVFETTYNGPFLVDHLHIETVEFLSISKIRRLIIAGERTFTPTFLAVLDFYESRWLIK